MHTSFRMHHASFRLWLAAAAGFVLPWRTVVLLQSGMLLGSPYALLNVGIFLSDVVLLLFACIGIATAARRLRIAMAIGAAALACMAAVNVTRSPDVLVSVMGWVRIALLAGALVGARAWRPYVQPFVIGFIAALMAHAAFGFVQFVYGTSSAAALLGIAVHRAADLGASVVETANGRWLRAYGGFPHPNVFGTALLVGIIATVSLWHRRVHDRAILRAFLRVAYPVFVAALFLTFSRAAWIGLGVLLVVVCTQRHTRRLGVLGIAILMVCTAIAWPLIRTRITPGSRLAVISTTQRYAALDDARVLFLERPWLGVGLHAMPRAVAAQQPQRAPYTVEPVHNVPLLAFVEVGVIGVIVIILLVVAALSAQTGVRPQLTWLALLPTLMFDHHLWSLAVGSALLFALIVVSLVPAPRAVPTSS